MDNVVVEWEAAGRRATAVREELARFAKAGETLPPAKVVELAELEVEVLTKLQAMHRGYEHPHWVLALRMPHCLFRRHRAAARARQRFPKIPALLSTALPTGVMDKSSAAGWTQKNRPKAVSSWRVSVLTQTSPPTSWPWRTA